MRSNLRLYHKMFHQISQWLKGERVTRRHNLALLVVGLYLAQSVYLNKIGSKLPIVAKKTWMPKCAGSGGSSGTRCTRFTSWAISSSTILFLIPNCARRCSKR